MKKNIVVSIVICGIFLFVSFFDVHAYMNRLTGEYTSICSFSSGGCGISSYADEHFKEEQRKYIKGKVETFCAPGVNNSERCNKYCKDLIDADLTHKYCGHSVTANVKKEDFNKYQSMYALKVETFCRPGAKDQKKCAKYCGKLTENRGTHVYCGHTQTRVNTGKYSSDKNIYMVKVEVFCAPGVNQPEKCSKYCKKLAKEKGVHQYCGTVKAQPENSIEGNVDKISEHKKSPAIDKNKDKVSVKTEDSREITTTIVTDKDGKEIEKEVIEVIQNEDDSREVITTITTKSKEEIIKTSFNKNDQRIKKEFQVINNKGTDSETTMIETFYFNENGNMVEKIVKNKKQNDDDFNVVIHNAYNNKLKEYETDRLKFLNINDKIEKAKVIYDSKEGEIKIFEKNALNEIADNKNSFSIKIKDGKIVIDDKNNSVEIDGFVSIDNKIGNVSVGATIDDEKMKEIKFLPDDLYKKAGKELSKIESIEIIKGKDAFVYEVIGKIDKKILKLFTISLDSIMNYDVSDGKLINQKTQTVWERAKSKF